MIVDFAGPAGYGVLSGGLGVLAWGVSRLVCAVARHAAWVRGEL